jgi:hypothetical protein
MRQSRIVIVLLGLLAGAAAMGLEKPQYTVLSATSDYELRQYAPYLVAATRVRADFEAAGDEGFRRLLRYISGHNQASSKIAMTAPVGQTRGQKIAMTAPVSQRPEDDAWLVTFMMPSQLTLQALPRPRDERVRLEQVPGRLMAALRYSGRWTEKRYQRHLSRLQTALADAGLSVVGEPELARYDPPFMPWPFRRNEVLIPVAPVEPARAASL